MRRRPTVLLTAAALAVALAGCSSAGTAADVAPSHVDARPSDVARPSGVALPPVDAAFDYQLGGSSPVPDGAGIVVRDSTEGPAAGTYGICYVNAFQTQPGASWPDDLLLQGDDGPLVDPGWPDEHLLDASTPAKRAAVAARQATTIDRCAAAGHRAVELDNLDSWTRSAGALDADDALALAALLVDHAHGRGLAVAQKNAADLGTRGRDEAGFDLAIAEECDRWDECTAFTDVYGPHVLDVEYVDDLRDTAEGACARTRALDPAPRAVVRDRDLVPAGEDGYDRAAC